MQIYLSAWCIRQSIQDVCRSLQNLPEFVASHEFTGIEIADRQILNFDSEYLEDLKKMCKKFGCGVILDVSSDLTYLNDKDWMDQIVYIQNMLDAAKQIGAGKVRICLGGQSFSLQKIFNIFGRVKSNKSNRRSMLQPAKFLINRMVVNNTTVKLAHAFRKNSKIKVRNEALKIRRAIEALHKILPKARQLKIPLVIENHWGISSRPENIVKIINELSSPYLGTCPDFDNFPRKVNRYQGLQILAPNAFHVHAKSLNFDANGEERNIDYQRCLQILKTSGYNDTITVEYEGAGDPIQGCLRTRELILKYW